MKSPLPKALRVLIPAVLIVAWLVGASIGGPYFGKVSEVSTNDQTSYLPESADATQVQGLLDDFLGSDSIPAVVVFASDDELSDETSPILKRPSLTSPRSKVSLMSFHP